MPDTRPQREGAVVFIQRLLRFGYRVLNRFRANHGILLAGGVGYNVLLSAIPLLALLGVLLSHIVPEAQLVEVMSIQARIFGLGHSGRLLDAVRAFLDSREVVGLIAIPVMLFFSSFAFRMMEDAIAIIFHRPNAPLRNFWVSAALPFAFILVLGGLHSAKLVLYSVDFAEIEALGVRIPMSGFTTPQEYRRSRRFTMPWRKLADSRGAAHQPGRAFGHHTLRKSFVA
jgi:uncharacterized BrkB/YihY/UPF0761 family membrane protein